MATTTVNFGPVGISGFVAVKASCSGCDYTAWTSGDPDRDWTHLIDDHLAQHAPDRAVDIEVDWEPSAWCPVCDDGGDICQEDDGLMCRECGTTWDMDGSNGYRSERA